MILQKKQQWLEPSEFRLERAVHRIHPRDLRAQETVVLQTEYEDI